MNLLRTQWVAALGAIVMLSGCGEGGPDVQYVEGIVTLDGKPIEGVTVSFSPMGPTGGSGLAAVGTTDANGVYKLTATSGGEFGKGTTVGEYNVGFAKTAKGESLSYEDTQKLMEDPNYGKTSKGPSAAPKSKDELPMGYKNPLTSGFTVSVKEGTNKGAEFNFDLKSDFKPK